MFDAHGLHVGQDLLELLPVVVGQRVGRHPVAREGRREASGGVVHQPGKGGEPLQPFQDAHLPRYRVVLEVALRSFDDGAIHQSHVRGGCILGMELVRLWQSETPRRGRRVSPVGGTLRDFVDVPLRRVQQGRLRGEFVKEDARDCYEYARCLQEGARTGGALQNY